MAMPVIVSYPAAATRTGARADRMGVVEADKPRPVRSVRFLRGRRHTVDTEAHPVPSGHVNHEDLTVQIQQRIQARVTRWRLVHGQRLSQTDNTNEHHCAGPADCFAHLARRGQPVIVTPFTLAGAMAPVTLTGAVTQFVAEGLAAIVLLQCVKPGVPCAIGSFTSNVDMRTGAPAFGTPEYIRATQISGQMARFYGLPLRASNACAANCPDAQAAWESAFSLWSAVAAGVNVVYHAAGWLEGGLCASYEKFVMDCETLQQIVAYLKPVPVTEEDIAVEAIREVGPTGHFFGCRHTRDRYETAFYGPFLSDWSNFESWEERGAIDTPRRANALWKKILAEFEAPPMDEAIREELAAFVERRKREGGAPTDF